MSKRAWLPALIVVAVLSLAVRADDKDLLQSVKERAKAEAQRVERDFTDGRAEAYKLVRSDAPKLTESTQKLEDLLSMVEKDKSLDAKRRQVLIVTLKWDLDKVKEIAAERRKPAVNDRVPPSVIRRDLPRDVDEPRKGATKDAKSVIESRKGSLEGSRNDREKKRDAYSRTMTDVDRSAVPETATVKFPKDWVEKSKRRGSGIKMTAKERAIMTALNKTLDVDFKDYTFSEVIDYLKKMTGLDLIPDKRGLDDVSVTYDTKINLKVKASTRTVIRRVLADLGLSYYVKDEAVQVTSLERARQQTTARAYYVGDLALVTDVRLPLAVRQIEMIGIVNQIISMVKSFDPQSWKDNNAEAPGTVTFDPVTMSLVVRQTAEVHFMMAGK